MEPERTAAVASLTYLVRSLLAIPDDRRTTLVGPGAKPWSELLESVTRHMTRELRPVVVPLLSALARQPEAMTPEQRASTGEAARRLLAFAWGESRRDRGMVHVGIEGVCRTFESAPAESTAVIRRILEPSRLA